MSQQKEKWTVCKKHIWEFIKQSFMPAMMYFVASLIVFVVLMRMGEKIDEQRVLTWSFICGGAALLYHGIFAYMTGGAHYEMLVMGNMKRRSEIEQSKSVRMSAYKYEKEYRPWKGFVIGAISSWALIVGGIFLGCNQSALSPNQQISSTTGGFLMFLDAFAGYVLLPIQAYNEAGVYVSGFIGCMFAILPIVVSGLFYILGAYARRDKRLREQQIAKAIEEAEQNKPKKINYGGLPGTKPKKK